ncbi:MAG: OmpA family protein, partial [Phycisphaerales bacterium]
MIVTGRGVEGRRVRNQGTRARLIAGAMGLCLCVLGGGPVGCSSNSDLIETNRTLTERIEQLIVENKRLKGELETANAEIAALRQSNADLVALRDQLMAENQMLREQLRRFGSDLESLKFSALDPTTDAALRELAAQYPDLLEYDSARGMIRFKSDVTFASGSDEVSDAGRRTIDALAKILISPAASSYDVRIVGHTDSQRMSGPTAAKHRTNWHLSTHRAISVGRELMAMGVAQTRLEAAGHGEYDPLVPNTASGNTPQNRRVEVFLVRGTNKQDGGTGAITPPPIEQGGNNFPGAAGR